MKFEELEFKINKTLKEEYPQPEKVLHALGKLSDNVKSGYYDSFIKAIGEKFFTGGIKWGETYRETDSQISKVLKLISEDTLRQRLKNELPDASDRVPLGVILHIGAGNMPGLGAFSVIEGLLSGNINVLKPAASDSIISGFILRELVRAEPELKPYIYMFDIPSESADVERKIKKLISLSDAVSIWGGDEAVRFVRNLAGPDKRLIEWGHKFSFVCITKRGLKDKASLQGLFEHISKTKMRLCSSCQAVYIEAENSDELYKAVQYINSICKYNEDTLGQAAADTLLNYTDRLFSELRGDDRAPGLNLLGCPVKGFDRESLFDELRSLPYSLQTAGLICGDDERAGISQLLIKAGAHRVRKPADMSEYIPGEYHDGRAPLYEYTRRAEIQSF